jgi:hypothetical protein
MSDIGTIFQELHSATSHKTLRLLLLATGAGSGSSCQIAQPSDGLELGFREFIPRTGIFKTRANRGSLRINSMTDEATKNQGQDAGQSGQQSGQQQQKNPQDISKTNPSQDRNEEQDEKQKQQDQSGQRRAS